MNNHALDTVVPIRPNLRAVEQRVADTDDGYTRLANELYEELIGANLTRNQAKVAHAVCRKTYGFNKKLDRISDSQISELTRLPRQKVNKAKNELIAMRVLVREGSLIGPNKALSDWVIPDCHQNSDFVTKAVTKSVTKSVTALSPKQGHTKDTITKDTITKDKKDNDSTPNGIECASAQQGEQGAQKSKPAQQEPKAPSLSCEAVLAVYHEVLPEAKGVRLLSDKRRNQIRTFWKKASKMTRQLDGSPFTLESWRQYLVYISENCRWMLEDRQDARSGRVWHRKGLEYFLSDETYLLVREGSKDDR